MQQTHCIRAIAGKVLKSRSVYLCKLLCQSTVNRLVFRYCAYTIPLPTIGYVKETSFTKLKKHSLHFLELDLKFLPIFGKFTENKTMKNTSISLGNYFDQFVNSQVSAGRYKNVSEVIRAGLRMLENEESKTIALRNAIKEGLNSPLVEDFDFDENLKKLKAEKRNNG